MPQVQVSPGLPVHVYVTVWGPWVNLTVGMTLPKPAPVEDAPTLKSQTQLVG